MKCQFQILSLRRLLLSSAKRQSEKETERDTDRQSVAVERREKRGDRKAVRQTDIEHKLKVWERK